MYSLNASKAGYKDGQFLSGVMGTIGGHVILKDGEWYRTADISLVKLGAISGRVSNERGEPMVGSLVRVLRRAKVRGESVWVAGSLARTDDRGDYRIAGLASGEYVVLVPSVQHSVPVGASLAELEGVTESQLESLDAQAIRRGSQPVRRSDAVLVDGSTALVLGPYPLPPSPPDGQPRLYPMTFHPSGSLVSAARIVVVDGDDVLGIDLTLLPARAVAVSGQLQGALDPKGVVLRLVPRGLESLGTGGEVATALVASDGSFRFLYVPEGEYTLMAPGSTFEFSDPSGFVAPGQQRLAIPPTPGVGRFGSGLSGGLVSIVPGITYTSRNPNTLSVHAPFVRMPIVVGPEGIGDLFVPVAAAGAIDCRVSLTGGDRATSTVGSLELAPADPVSGLGAHMFVLKPPSQGASVLERVSMSALTPGLYALRLVGASGLTIRSISIDGRDASTESILVEAGRSHEMEVVLTSQGGRLSGFVRSANGQALAGAAAIAFPVNTSLWRNYGFTPTWIRASPASSDGSYVLSGIRAGQYYVVGVPSHQISKWADPSFLELAAAQSMRVSVAWGEVRTLDVPAFRGR
jgi:hypothetical protein